MNRLITVSAFVLVIIMTGTGCRRICGRICDREDHFMAKRHYSEMDRMHRGMPWMEKNMRPERIHDRINGEMMPGDPGSGFMQPDRLPGLTEKQRQALSDLRLKNMEEMDKFREESFAKLQNIRESQRKAFMNILTEEQKKFLESGAHQEGPAQMQPDK
jgi:arylamine N-acetyltransferase